MSLFYSLLSEEKWEHLAEQLLARYGGLVQHRSNSLGQDVLVVEEVAGLRLFLTSASHDLHYGSLVWQARSQLMIEWDGSFSRYSERRKHLVGMFISFFTISREPFLASFNGEQLIAYRHQGGLTINEGMSFWTEETKRLLTEAYTAIHQEAEIDYFIRK